MKTMRMAAAAFCLSFAALGLTAAQAGTIEITVTPWVVPNGSGSASFPGAQANAIYALQHGLSSYGDPNLPTYYHAQSSVSAGAVTVTSFHSWLGMADPGTVFGPAFANEYGNRMHFGFVAVGDGMQFSVDQLGFSASSTDPYDALAMAFPNGYTYSAALVGIRAGVDGVLGTGDDVFITSGPASQLVDELVGRGSGNAFWPMCSGCTIAEQQAAINDVAAYPGYDFDFTGTYTIGNFSGSGTFNIKVPEPSTLILFGAALVGLGLFGFRSRRKTAA